MRGAVALRHGPRTSSVEAAQTKTFEDMDKLASLERHIPKPALAPVGERPTKSAALLLAECRARRVSCLARSRALVLSSAEYQNPCAASWGRGVWKATE